VVHNDNLTEFFDVKGTETVIDYGRSNHFKYQETIFAAYVSARKSWKRFSSQLGLRMENTQSSGTQLGNDAVSGSSFTKQYTELFPAVFLNYKLDSTGRNSLTFSITRRIGRPNYYQLNPFIFFRDQYSYTSGNPMLTPQYQNRFELKYQHRQFLTFKFSYNYFTDVIFQTTNTVDKIFITRPENLASGFMLLYSTNLSFRPVKWWYLNTDVMLSYMGINGAAYNEQLTPRTVVARVNLLNQLEFSKSWTAELGTYFASKDLNGQTFTGPRFRANAAVQKKIWKDKGSLRLSMDDIFHSWIQKNSSIDVPQSWYSQTSESDTQRVGLAFTYRFGKESFARKRKYNNNAAEDEKGRVN
jgi:hypothetical protein